MVPKQHLFSFKISYLKCEGMRKGKNLRDPVENEFVT